MKAQDLSKEMNSYVFPLFRMTFPMISYLKEQNVGYFTCAIAYLQPVLWFFFTVIEKFYIVICFDR